MNSTGSTLGTVVRARTERRRLGSVTLSLALLMTVACKQQRDRSRYVPGSAPAVLGVKTDDIKNAIAGRVAGEQRPSWVSADRWKRVRATYARYANAPLWLESDGVKDRATALLNALESAPDHALSTEAYPLDSIQKVVDDPAVTKQASAKALADADVLLTSAYVAYATDMLIGQIDPKTVSQAWRVPTRMAEVDSALIAALQEPSMDSALAALAPADSEYVVLKNAYVQYRKIVASGGWPRVTAGSATAPVVRRRLAIEGYLTDSVTIRPASNRQNTATPVGAAIKIFQARHGLPPTGSLGAATVSELNVSADERAKQIALNLERHRWLPRSLGARYVYVNVPSFRLDAYDSGRKVLSMKVVVGAEYQGRNTPVFSDTMETVVFRPYWNVTPDIQANEIAPKIASNPGYLDANDMEYYKDGGATRIRQRPGSKNSLGLVKFLFPNSFNIYLHDTPAKSLFAKTNRAASHGCIRLEHPDQLAQFVLGWDAERVQSAMQSGPNNTSVRVPAKIPVYIVYFTAYARDGQVYFGDDIYSRDESLGDKVAEQPDTLRQ